MAQTALGIQPVLPFDSKVACSAARRDDRSCRGWRERLREKANASKDISRVVLEGRLNADKLWQHVVIAQLKGGDDGAIVFRRTRWSGRPESVSPAVVVFLRPSLLV